MTQKSNSYLVLPVIGIISMLVLFPLLYSFYASFFASIRVGGLPTNFIGFDNYVKALSSSEFLGSLQRTFRYTVTSITFKIILGMITALLLNFNFRGRGVVRGLMIMPWSMPIFVAAMIFFGIYDYTGPANTVTKALGLGTFDWLGNELAMGSCIFFNIWRGFPFFFMGLLSGLQGIPYELYEAADVDGTNRLQSFFYITLPCLRPVLLTVTLLSTIWTFSEVVSIHLLTHGGPGYLTQVLGITVFKKAFGEYQPNIAVSMCICILPFYMFLIYWVTKLLARGDQIDEE